MKLAAFLYPTGYHVAAWRHPDVQADAGVSFRHYVALAQTAERGKFDFIFLADSATMRGNDLPALSRTAIRYVAQFEPITLLSALSAVTSCIGLVASASTTYNEPYRVAREFASLDHISEGRAGWNVVTSQNEDEAHVFGLGAHPDHEERYLRAGEFVPIVKALWDSWEDDAFVRNKQTGVFFDPQKLHPVAFRGRFCVRGVLNLPRPPQGYPIIVQSGSSDMGKDLAAREADIVFTAQNNLEDAKAFYADMKERTLRLGRSPDDIFIMPGICPFVGRTKSQAEDKLQFLQSLIHPVVGLSLLSGQLGGVDLSKFSLDGPLPTLPETNAGRSRQHLLMEMADRENLTLRELCLRVAGARGHLQITGSPRDIVDEMFEWFDDKAADGFNVIPPFLPGGLEDFVDLVIPELQRRGFVRRNYEGRMLRENLGLPRPKHRHGCWHTGAYSDS